MMTRKSFQVFADYYQFYLWDRGMTPQAPVDYAPEDVQRRIKTGPFVVVVQPARNRHVSVEVEVRKNVPKVDPKKWDHVVEASLHLPTGQLEIHECTGGPVGDFAVVPGWYRVRCFFGGLNTISESGLDGDDRYLLVLWPASPGEVKVIKQWANDT